MWRFLTAMTVLFTSVCAASAADNCALEQVAAIDLTLDETGRVDIPMSIGDNKLTMLVDTGGLYSMLSEETVNKLGLRRLPVPPNYRMVMFGGIHIRNFVPANAITLGNLQARGLGFLVMPAGRMQDINGTIAPDLLRNYDVEFNPAGGKLNFFSPEHCTGKVVYWTHDPYAKLPITVNEWGRIDLPVTLDGRPFQATLDSGAAFSVVTIEAARKLFGWGEKVPNLTPLPNKQGEANFYRYPFSTLTFEGITVNHPDVLLVTEAHRGFGDLAPDMTIGMSILRQLRTYIAYHEHNIYFTAAEAH